jgi:hypothetical protein
MKAKLSDRIRPNSEVLPWIYEEIKLLENQLDEERLISDTQSGVLEYQAKRNAELVAQIEAMRDAITEADNTISFMNQLYADDESQTAKYTLVKLQPFLKK